LQKPTSNFFKIYSVSTSDISDMDRGEGRGIKPVLTFFWTRGGQFFMILCRRPLWMPSEQKKTAKLSMGYRPTNCNS